MNLVKIVLESEDTLKPPESEAAGFRAGQGSAMLSSKKQCFLLRRMKRI